MVVVVVVVAVVVDDGVVVADAEAAVADAAVDHCVVRAGKEQLRL